MIISPPIEIAPTLLSAPIELAGKWGHMLPRSADLVVEPPADPLARRRAHIRAAGRWLHPDRSTMACIIVDIGEVAAGLPVRSGVGSRHG